MTRYLSILIILACMGVTPYHEPVHHVFDWSYERQIFKQVHHYHGIPFSTCPQYGEPYFIFSGQKCRVFTSIKSKGEWQAYKKAQEKAGLRVEKYTEWRVIY